MKLHYNRRRYRYSPEGFPVPRVWHRAARGKVGPRFLIKCGDCDNSVEIYHGPDDLEINGVIASREDWARILVPLLQGRQRTGGASRVIVPSRSRKKQRAAREDSG